MRVFTGTILILFLTIQCEKAENFDALTLFENKTGEYACYRIPAIINTSNGTLLAFAEGRKLDCGDFGKVDILLRRSNDGGKNWSPQKIIATYKNLQAGNPAPVVDQYDLNYPNGRIFLFYNTGTVSEHEMRLGKGVREVWYKTSEDNGINWSEGVNITSQVHFNANSLHPDMDWRTHANTPGHALQFKKGKFQGRIYIPANHSQGPPQEKYNDYRAYGFYSDDHGLNWKVSPDVEVASSNEAIGVELSNGDLMLNIREQNGNTKERLIAISKDGGASWEKTYFDAELISPVCQSSLLQFIKDQDTLLLFSGPNSREKREKMTLKISLDQGQNWTYSKLIHEGASSYSDLVQIDSNTLGVLYEKGSEGISFQILSGDSLLKTP
ncbi:MAG: glycoside hydrolase [Flavobacteriaceae bacterium]|nr:glycoside hydrolase [Flavobacteriaceae bacterium]